MPVDPTHVVLLAAGHGTRLGRDKPTLSFAGETLLARHIRQALIAEPDARFVIVANPANIETIRLAVAPLEARAEVILQEGPDAHAGAHTGLRRARGASRLFLAGITDLVPDDTYLRLATMDTPAPLRITTTALRKTFIGGMLERDPLTGTVHRIIERPPGGCPPGAAANIWIHYIDNRDTIACLTEATGHLNDYEQAVNHAIATGTTTAALTVERWVSIKGPDSIQDAHEIFGLTADIKDTAA